MRSVRKRLVLGGVWPAGPAGRCLDAGLAGVGAAAAPADPTMARPAAPGLGAVKETMKDAVKEAVGMAGRAGERRRPPAPVRQRSRRRGRRPCAARP